MVAVVDAVVLVVAVVVAAAIDPGSEYDCEAMLSYQHNDLTGKK